jgi:hypothetical protein
MTMLGFLNEHSLEDHVDWEASLRLFLVAAQELSAIQTRLFKDSAFFFGPGFAQRFNALSFPKDQRALIRELVFGSRYYKCWRTERLSIDTDFYSWLEPVQQIRDESICEAAERQIRDDALSTSILSAADSVFRDQDRVSVSKVATGQQIQLRALTSLPMVKQWIGEQKGYYDPRSSAAPRDFQTILGTSPRFRATGKVERRFSRRVFEEIGTGRLFYVDEGHPGHSAHLEVFSPTYEHLGTADINTGEIDVSQRKDGRILKL